MNQKFKIKLFNHLSNNSYYEKDKDVLKKIVDSLKKVYGEENVSIVVFEYKPEKNICKCSVCDKEIEELDVYYEFELNDIMCEDCGDKHLEYSLVNDGYYMEYGYFYEKKTRR